MPGSPAARRWPNSKAPCRQAETRWEPGRAPTLTKSIADKVDAEPEHVAQLVRAMIAQDEK
jgi:hypothetical protein